MIGKTMPGFKGIGTMLVLGLTMFASCSKEISDGSPVTVATDESQSVQQLSELSSISDSALAKFFKVPFGTRGSRTTFRGYVSDTTATISLDYFIAKKFKYVGDKKLTLDYGDYGLYSKGWKYIISYNQKKGEITLAPNDVMASQTKARSFKTIVATFDKATSTFNFLTEVKDVNGYVHQVNEIIRRQ